MQENDQSLRKWNRWRNGRRDTERRRMLKEDKHARKQKLLRIEFERCNMASEDKRARAIRSFLMKEKATELRACILIQAWIRGHRVRSSETGKRIRSFLEDFRAQRTTAATKIQAMWRGYRLRKKLKSIKEKALLGDDEDDDGFDYGGIQEDFLPAMPELPEIGDVFRNAKICIQEEEDLNKVRVGSSSSKRQAQQPSVKLPPVIRGSMKGKTSGDDEEGEEKKRRRSSRNQNKETYQEKLRRLAAEWHTDDLQLVETMLKRQKRMKKLTKKGGSGSSSGSSSINRRSSTNTRRRRNVSSSSSATNVGATRLRPAALARNDKKISKKGPKKGRSNSSTSTSNSKLFRHQRQNLCVDDVHNGEGDNAISAAAEGPSRSAPISEQNSRVPSAAANGGSNSYRRGGNRSSRGGRQHNGVHQIHRVGDGRRGRIPPVKNNNFFNS
eukprot:jgi/Bigna1/136986/aug1.37_g11694